MKRKLTGKAVILGAGAGVALFAVYGLLPGSFFGGVAGLSFAGWLFGYPVGTGILTRVILAVFMLLGIMGSGILFVAGGSLAGWVAGTLIDSIAAPEALKAGEKIKAREDAVLDSYVIGPGTAKANEENES